MLLRAASRPLMQLVAQFLLQLLPAARVGAFVVYQSGKHKTSGRECFEQDKRGAVALPVTDADTAIKRFGRKGFFKQEGKEADFGPAFRNHRNFRQNGFGVAALLLFNLAIGQGTDGSSRIQIPEMRLLGAGDRNWALRGDKSLALGLAKDADQLPQSIRFEAAFDLVDDGNARFFFGRCANLQSRHPARPGSPARQRQMARLPRVEDKRAKNECDKCAKDAEYHYERHAHAWIPRMGDRMEFGRWTENPARLETADRLHRRISLCIFWNFKGVEGDREL